MSLDPEFTRKTLSLVGMILPWVLVIAWTVLKSEARGRMFVRWLLTFFILVVSVWLIEGLVHTGDKVLTIAALFIAGLSGFAFAVTWTEPFGAWLARMLISSFDGAMTPPEPAPVYSIARARQHQGRYAEAVAEIQSQLSRFPSDFEGQLFLAEVFAENLRDVEYAQAVIDQVCAQPGHAPGSVARALYAMADWHLAVAGDRVAARRCLERGRELLPNTEHSLTAVQRIARLAEPSCGAQASTSAVGPASTSGQGPQVSQSSIDRSETVPIDIAQCLERLERFPLDCEARERLALIHADHLGRLDLASEQLEQMIAIPKQPVRNVVRGLNLLADIQVRLGEDPATVERTLNRIIQLYPRQPMARLARNRITLLGLEIKAQKKSRAVKLGSYEQNIGLKRALMNEL